VRAGVADYGNRLGIPTVNGAILFDERYLANPLVYCGTMGLMPADKTQKGKHNPGDLIVLIGGKTGRDGIHGATFASEQLTDESGRYLTLPYRSVTRSWKRRSLISCYRRATGVYTITSPIAAPAVYPPRWERWRRDGRVWTSTTVPLKYSGLNYAEIWISESPGAHGDRGAAGNIDEVLKLCESEDVPVAVIGEFTGDKHLNLFL